MMQRLIALIKRYEKLILQKFESHFGKINERGYESAKVGRIDHIKHAQLQLSIYINNKYLIPAKDGQFTPAISGHSQLLLQP